MPLNNAEGLIQLLGKTIDEPEINALRESGDCEVIEIDPIVYYAFYPRGLSLQFDDQILGTIILYSEGVEDYEEYSSALPHGLRFSMKQGDVLKLLGAPARRGPDTDIYAFPDHVMYVEYKDKPKTINTVTLMTLSKEAE
jgi:hypothetical protein